MTNQPKRLGTLIFIQKEATTFSILITNFNTHQSKTHFDIDNELQFSPTKNNEEEEKRA